MLRAWLSYADDLRSIGPGLCGNLARWLPLFRATDGFESDGEMMLADLVGIQAEILSLDPSLLAPRISEKLVTPSDKEVRDVATLAAAVVRSASGLGRLNPTRWVRRSMAFSRV